MATAKFQEMSAAADFLGNGAIEINMYESEIFDIVRRNSIARQRFPAVRATGHPHRYFEQTAIATGSFADPRNLQTTLSASPQPTGPTRVERPAFIKAVTGQTNFSLFDIEVTKQQGVFTSLQAKDLEDLINGVIVTSGIGIWTGTDTSLAAPTTIQYVGALTQITLQSTIAPGASIIDGLKSQVAAMVANPGFDARPTAIYANQVLLDYIDREAKAQAVTMNEVEVVAGVKAKAIQTQAGLLPLIGDAFLPAATAAAYGFAAPPAGLKTYFAVIVTENAVERPYISGDVPNPEPRIFQLGLTNSLSGQYVAVCFDSIIFKGASYAHAVVAINRA